MKDILADLFPVLAAFVCFPFVGIGLSSLLPRVNPPPELACRLEAVVVIGGCDRLGYCGVKTESGAFTHARYPVVGKQVQVCVEKE